MARPAPYRLFHVEVRERIALSPSLVRFVFTGAEVGDMDCPGPDQRIKVFFPLPGQQAPQPPDGEDWYARYRAQPADARPPMRTYTISALRGDVAEVDVDFVLHGEHGPASRWAMRADAGDRVALLAPQRGAGAGDGGYEWKPPADMQRLLLAGDETALPALLGILRDLAGWPRRPPTDCLLEVPLSGDVLPLPEIAGVTVHWLPRDGAPHGQRLQQRVQRLVPATSAATAEAVVLDETLPDDGILWERAAPAGHGFHAWIAGESGAVMAIRRHLVKQAGIDRSQVTFMGYWRLGHALD